jgi:hypothetical protein
MKRPIILRPDPPGIEVPARFKPLSCEQIARVFASDISLGSDPVLTTRAAEVRCPVRDCPGRGGWVVEHILGSLGIHHDDSWPNLFYVAPRGYTLGRDITFAPTERMKKQLRRGFNEAAGRRPTRRHEDVLAAPLPRSGMTAETWGFATGGWLVQCPSCRVSRLLRVTIEAAVAHLSKERCGMLDSRPTARESELLVKEP